MTVINEEIYKSLRALDRIYLSIHWDKLDSRYREVGDCREQMHHISLYTTVNAPPALKNQ